MSDLNNANFPGVSRISDDDGNVTDAWRGFFLALLNRTGGQGTPPDITGLQSQVNAQDVEINTAVPVQPKPVLIGESLMPVQRPQQADYSQAMVYQPPGQYALQNAAATFATLKAASNPKLMYQNGSAQSITSTLSTVTGWTAVFDTGGNFAPSTGIFTAPNAGQYLISGQLLLATTSPVAGDQFVIEVVANGVSVIHALTLAANATNPLQPCTFSTVISLAAGQTASIKASNSRTQALNSAAFASWISIVQIP